MHLLLVGTSYENNVIKDFINNSEEYKNRIIYYTETNNYDDMIAILSKNHFDAVFVLINGADGMEYVNTVKRVLPSTSLIWFSDDKGFGAYSYRIRAKFFAVKPVSSQIVINALDACFQGDN